VTPFCTTVSEHGPSMICSNLREVDAGLGEAAMPNLAQHRPTVP